MRIFMFSLSLLHHLYECNILYSVILFIILHQQQQILWKVSVFHVFLVSIEKNTNGRSRFQRQHMLLIIQTLLGLALDFTKIEGKRLATPSRTLYGPDTNGRSRFQQLF